jgi:hypothetical protein
MPNPSEQLRQALQQTFVITTTTTTIPHTTIIVMAMLMMTGGWREEAEVSQVGPTRKWKK